MNKNDFNIYDILGWSDNVSINGNGVKYCGIKDYKSDDKSNLFHEIHKSLGNEIKIYCFRDRDENKRLNLTTEKVRIVIHDFSKEESIKYYCLVSRGEGYLPSIPEDSFLKYIKSELIPNWKTWVKPFLWSDESIDSCDYRIGCMFDKEFAAYIIYMTPDKMFHARIYIHKEPSK